MIEATPEVVTWIKVQKPQFDLVGVVLGSMLLSAFLALLACLLGALGGLGLIRRRARGSQEPGARLTRLNLTSHDPSEDA